MQQYRVVRETTDNDPRGAYVVARTPQEALYSIRGLAHQENWAGTATSWHVYLDTKQWNAVYSEKEPS